MSESIKSPPCWTAPLERRRFLQSTTATAFAAASGLTLPLGWGALKAQGATADAKPDYNGPNVVVIRFGGGCRRREAIEKDSTTFAPYFYHELMPRGTLFDNVIIDTAAPDTGHGQGTLNILVGRYDKYEDVSKQFLGERFEANGATIFEYLRSAFNVPTHQALIINGEDRSQEEFYTFSNHHLFGVNYRSSVLSLFRFKEYRNRCQIEEYQARNAGKQVERQVDEWSIRSDKELQEKQDELHKMHSLDDRREGDYSNSEEIERFWSNWRAYYGDSGLLNPRGDSVLTELAERSMKELKPKLIMVNYNDCDYVHWGNVHHYHRAITIMDEGIRRIVQTADQLPEYKDNTVFVIVPDCGRDDARMTSIPCQHHFNSRSSRQIFALLFGPGIDRSRRVDRLTQQIDIAPTVAHLMGFSNQLVRSGAHPVEGRVLEEAFV